MNLQHFLLLDTNQQATAYHNLASNAKTNLLLQLSQEIRQAVIQGKVDYLIGLYHLALVLRNQSTNTHFKKVDQLDPFQGINFILLACKHQHKNILEFLFKINYTKNPNEVDAEGYTAFYYAILSNNIELLKLLLTQWPYSKEIDEYANDNTDQGLKNLYDLLHKPYQALKTLSKLSEEMITFIKSELKYCQFQRGIAALKESHLTTTGLSLPSVQNRINIIINLIRLIEQYYQPNLGSVSHPTYRPELLAFSLIAQNIQILKRQIRITYNQLPWEQIEFFLTRFISFTTKQKRIDEIKSSIFLIKNDLARLESDYPQNARNRMSAINKSKLDNKIKLANEAIEVYSQEMKEILIKYIQPSLQYIKNEMPNCLSCLNQFRIELAKISPILKESDINTHLPENSEAVKGFEQLYSQYEKMKDEYSLDRILRYINLALKGEATSQLRQLVIKRALQVMGEYFKNSPESPHLSSWGRRCLEHLDISIPDIESLRDYLSHSYTLLAREEFDKHSTEKYIDIQENLAHILQLILSIRQKLGTAIDPDSLSKPPAENNTAALIHFTKTLEKRNFATAEEKKSIQDAIDESKKHISEAKEKLIKFFNNEVTLTVDEYKNLINQLQTTLKIKKSLLDIYDDHSNWVNGVTEVEMITDQFQKLNTFLEYCQAIPENELNNIIKSNDIKDKKIIELLKQLNKIFSGKQTRRLNLSSIFLSKLELLKKIFLEVFPDFEQILTVFKNPKTNNIEALKMKAQFMKLYETREDLQAAVEYILSDARDILQELSLSHLLGQLFLRNYLAHGDPLRDALVFDPLTTILSDALTLLVEGEYIVLAKKIKDILNKNQEIKNKVKNDISTKKFDEIEKDLSKISEALDLFIKLRNSSHWQAFLSHILEEKKDNQPASIKPSVYDELFSWQRFEDETLIGNFNYLLQQRDIAELARIIYGFTAENSNFEVIGSNDQLNIQLQQHITNHALTPLTLIINLGQSHWITLVISITEGQYVAHYRDSYGAGIPDEINEIVKRHIVENNIYTYEGTQQSDVVNCGLLALENAYHINQMVAGNISMEELRNQFSHQPNASELNDRRINFANQLILHNNPNFIAPIPAQSLSSSTLPSGLAVGNTLSQAINPSLNPLSLPSQPIQQHTGDNINQPANKF